jgi:hypothetical protein
LPEGDTSRWKCPKRWAAVAGLDTEWLAGSETSPGKAQLFSVHYRHGFMTWFQLAASLVQSLAWPVFALLIAVVLRRPIARLLAGRPPSKVKAGPFEVEWARGVAETETEVGAAPSQGAPQLPHLRLSDELRAEVTNAPAVAVMEAHATVERALLDVVEGLPGADRRMSAVALARLAEREGRIGEPTRRAVEGISVLRNLAAHGSAREITPQQAEEYLTLADAVLYSLPAR